MGSFLDKPITEKDTECGEGTIGGHSIRFGVSGMQGWRVEMEDAHAHVIGEVKTGENPGGATDLGFFGVFDGHGGSMVSRYSSEKLLCRISSLAAFKAAVAGGGSFDNAKIQEALEEGFIALDAEMKQLPAVMAGQDHSGSTAVTCFITPTHIIVGNCGDSRLVVARSGSAVFGSEDHKPTMDSEKTRIYNAGGTVSMGRVNGDLAVSRALGDFVYKQCADMPAASQQVSAFPEVTILERTDEDQFVVLACDGIWDVMNNQECVDIILGYMNTGYSLERSCEMLIDECLNRGSRDNMSVCIVALPAAPATIGTWGPPPSEEAPPEPAQ